MASLHSGPYRFTASRITDIFFHQALVRQSRPAARHFSRITIQQHGRHGTARRGVADPHLSGGDQPVPFFLQLPSHANSRGNGRYCGFPGHGRFFMEILCSISQFFPYQRVSGAGTQIYGDSDINRKHVHSRPVSHEADTAVSIRHIFSYHGSDFLSGLCYTFFNNAVITAHDNQRPFTDIDMLGL